MSLEKIPFNRPATVGRELEYVAQALANGHVSGDGPFTKKCCSQLESFMGGGRALLTTSCTHALEMAALLLDIGPGDEFIVPSFTFVSTVNAFVLRGAKPVFVDVRPDTLNMDEGQLSALVSSRTKAIVPVHYAGVGCEMDAIMAVAGRSGVAVVEDAAQALFGLYKGKPLGSFGELSAFSFHETKNVQCGEGGALLVNDPKFRARAEIIREKGTNRSQFFRGQVDKYTWVDVGSSYLPSDMLAGFLLAQLEQAETIVASRKAIWQRYASGLGEWAAQNGVVLPSVPAHCTQSYHMFYILLPSLERRQAMIAHLRELGIQSVYHYVPLHLSEMGARYGGRLGALPVTEHVGDCLLRLPFFIGLTPQLQDRVLDAVRMFSA